ncbi:tyrosine-type recombinase/integrase [Streptomyces coriariae]|uniref:tyrosine-type recombinase/integrase n=1 Tax=Streptomyces coriariae TaxID=2864460 RepID=UPI001E4517A9|nr:tyrosine-type recombinase/integrase [Streptomyces coriariae]
MERTAPSGTVRQNRPASTGQKLTGQVIGPDRHSCGRQFFPSERVPSAIAALNLPVAPFLLPDTFRKVLKEASKRHLKGALKELHPHLLRHACATHNYEAGMPLWDVQVLLGHTWASTTVGYLATAKGDPERQSLESSRRAVRRLRWES